MGRPKTPRQRLDHRVVEQALAGDLREARGLIMAGRVLVDDTPVNQAGTLVRTTATVRLRGERPPFASRGGLKLEAALDRFGVDVRGRVVLDAGASTGGFTDCLLQRGARRVYAVDVGYGQLRGRLAADPRVENRERTNIADLSVSCFEPPINLSTADLSYVSLRRALAQLRPLFAGEPELVVLVKPLFEGLSEADVTREGPLLRVLEDFIQSLPRVELALANVMTSPVFGGRGSIEFLAHLRGASAQTPVGPEGRNNIEDWTERVRPGLHRLLRTAG